MLNGKHSSIQNLIRFFSLMFTTVPETSDLFKSVGWNHFVAIWKLTSALDKKQVTRNDVTQLYETIKYYMNSFFAFKKHMEERHKVILRITPKHLWLMAYPRIISYVGPLSSLDTNLGEMKNYQLKLASQKANQTKNTIKTMAIREAQRFTLENSSQISKNIAIPSNPVVFDDLPEDVRHHCLTNDLCETSHIFYSKLLFMGAIFRATTTCGIIYQKNLTTNFGVISTIAFQKNSKQISFVVQNVNLTGVPNLCLKECELSSVYKIVKQTELFFERPVYIYNVNCDDGVSKDVVCIWRE